MLYNKTGHDMLTVSEAADLVGVWPQHIRRKLASGELAGIKVGPRAWLIPRDEVERFAKMESRRGRPRSGGKNRKRS